MTLALDLAAKRSPARPAVHLALWLGASALILSAVVAAIWPALRGVPFWDDLYSILAIDVAHQEGRPGFLVTGDTMAFWRPIELALIAGFRALDPVAYLPVKLVAVALHAVKAAAIVLIARRLAPTLPASVAAFAGLIALAHPIAVAVLVQIDTVSEAVAAAFVAWAFVAVLGMAHEGRQRRLRLVLAACLATIALFGKESAVPAVMALPLVGLICAHDRRRALPDLIWFAILLAVAIACFVALRFWFGFTVPHTNDDRYAVGFGLNVVRNVAVVGGSLAYFGSTLELIAHRAPLALLGFLPILGGLGLMAVALIRAPGRFLPLIDGRTALAALVLGLAAVAAPSLAPAISEHNAALPSAAAIALGVALVAAAAAALGRPAWRLAAICGVLAIGMGLAAMVGKAEGVAETGQRAEAAREAIDTYLYGHDKLFICVTPTPGTSFSIFQLAAQRWIGEEVVWARRNWPAKEISGALREGGPGCDMTIPDLPVSAR